MVDIHTNKFRGVHRTALQLDGNGKAVIHGLPIAKKMLGSSRNACVKLCPDDDVAEGLGIAEGIETALAVIGNFGFRPVWATLSASAMAAFPVLSGVECLTVFADNDHPRLHGNQYRQAGNSAAETCAIRWTKADRECVIWTPAEIGSDFNDIAQRVA